MPAGDSSSEFNLVLGGAIFTEGGYYSPVNNILGRQYSVVNNVRGGTVHYDSNIQWNPA